MSKVRCAIYTRKSSEEGLEQDFNSLDAQHAACSAYVASQTSEGWSLLPDRYDDGGLSGGTMERPALKRLLGDIAAGKIDIVVVYKVDRLTRSLLDFATLVAAFDNADVSFVSVTQSFNTTSSMGRLTLNMLLSFAQFEREVTAERIRDKIAASKARGMWMGGTPPLGYRPDGRTLAVVEPHADLIRLIYRRYLALGNVRLLREDLHRDKLLVPVRTTSAGRGFGGGMFSRGQLYTMLGNPIYIGCIRHGTKTYPGKHPAIVDQPLWDAVQERLAASIKGTRTRATAVQPSLLAGKVFDAAGAPLVAAHATKGKVRYRYYVSRALQHGGDAQAIGGLRVPAKEIEALVIDTSAGLFADPLAIATELGGTIGHGRAPALIKRSADLTITIQSKQNRTSLESLIERVSIADDSVTIEYDGEVLAGLLGLQLPTGPSSINRTVPARLKRSGMAVRLILPDNRSPGAGVDHTLVRGIARGRVWWQQLKDTPNLSVEDIARNEGLTGSYITRLMRLAFLAPEMVERIVTSDIPVDLSLTRLQRAGAIPALWEQQRQMFAIADR